MNKTYILNEYWSPASVKIKRTSKYLRPVCPRKQVRSWSHVPWVTTNNLLAKDFRNSVQRQRREREEEKLERQFQSFACHIQTQKQQRMLNKVIDIAKSQHWIEIEPSAQSPYHKQIFDNSAQKSRKSRCQSFLIRSDFAWCLYFVSYILLAIVGKLCRFRVWYKIRRFVLVRGAFRT